jgi:hypothetical protein
MAGVDVPSPFLQDADETSITLSFKATPELLQTGVLHLQYTLAHAGWDHMMTVDVEFDGESKEPKVSVAVHDLKPGTPYLVRLMLVRNDNGEVKYGPEVVFDTAPIGCTPKNKKKKCSIS